MGIVTEIAPKIGYEKAAVFFKSSLEKRCSVQELLAKGTDLF